MESKLCCIEFGWMKGKANCEQKFHSHKKLSTGKSWNYKSLLRMSSTDMKSQLPGID